MTLVDYEILPEVSDYVQGVFIDARKQEAEKGEVTTSVDIFHQWLTLARLQSVSEGQLHLT